MLMATLALVGCSKTADPVLPVPTFRYRGVPLTNVRGIHYDGARGGLPISIEYPLNTGHLRHEPGWDEVPDNGTGKLVEQRRVADAAERFNKSMRDLPLDWASFTIDVQEIRPGRWVLIPEEVMGPDGVWIPARNSLSVELDLEMEDTCLNVVDALLGLRRDKTRLAGNFIDGSVSAIRTEFDNSDLDCRVRGKKPFREHLGEILKQLEEQTQQPWFYRVIRAYDDKCPNCSDIGTFEIYSLAYLQRHLR